MKNKIFVPIAIIIGLSAGVLLQKYNLTFLHNHADHAGHADEHAHGEDGHDDHKNENEEDDHGHGHGGHGHGEGKSVAMTIWENNFEIFLEHPYMVKGQAGEFVTHVSYIDTGLAKTNESVEFIFQNKKTGEIVKAVENSPARTGIYLPNITLPKAGLWNFTLTIVTDGKRDSVELQPVYVFATKAEAEKAPEQPEISGISYLKEQQWKLGSLSRKAKQVVSNGNKVLTVPETAIVYVGNIPGIYIQVSGETVKYKRVALGDKINSEIIIKSGISANDWVIIRSGYAIAQLSSGKTESSSDEGDSLVELEREVILKHKISTAPTAGDTLKSYANLNGIVSYNSDKTAKASTMVAGNVRKVLVRTGDKVNKGDVLAVIESRELADFQIAFMKATQDLKIAKLAFKREEKLWKDKLSTHQDYLDKSQALENEKINLIATKQKLLALGYGEAYINKLPAEAPSNLTKFEILAPASGTIIHKSISLGEKVDNDKISFVIADTKKLWINFQVHEQEIHALKLGRVISVLCPEKGEAYDAKIEYISSDLDEQSRTCIARVAIENNNTFKVGQYVRGILIKKIVQAKIVIPDTAVQYISDKPYVFLKAEKGFIKRRITLGARVGKKLEVLSGLSKGQEIVVNNSFALKAEALKNPNAYGGHGHAH